MIINYLIHHYKLALALRCCSLSRLSQHFRNTGVSGKVVYLGTTLYHSIESVQRCCTKVLFYDILHLERLFTYIYLSTLL